MTKFMDFISGKWTQVVPITTSAGVADASKMAQTGADGKFDLTLMSNGVAPDQKTANANGAISARDICYVETAGTIARATAAAGTPKEGTGWATASALTGAPVTIQDEGIIPGFTGLTPGAAYFLSDVTPGGILIDPGPTGAGKIAQFLGYAYSATELNFEPDRAAWLA